jgi:hypothetical protein
VRNQRRRCRRRCADKPTANGAASLSVSLNTKPEMPAPERVSGKHYE